MKTLHTLAMAAALGFAFSSNAQAHGDDAHAKATGFVKKEQKDWGIAGDAKMAKRTIEISMLDTMRFSPEKIDVKQGDFDFACLIAGHYPAGMTGKISVAAMAKSDGHTSYKH